MLCYNQRNYSRCRTGKLTFSNGYDTLPQMLDSVTVSPIYLDTSKAIPLYQIRPFATFSNVVCAVFTRLGGVSCPPLATLNLGGSVGDTPEAVEQNFQIACEAVQVDPNQTVSCHLVHGAKVVVAEKATQRTHLGQADGLVTTETDTYLTMRFADCTPLLFFDPVRQAVGLAHAGWRGTMQNMAGATVKTMMAEGCQAENIIAIIGPAIGPCCYEVGTEVMNQAGHNFEQSETLFRHNGRAGHAYFDMWQANRRQLEAVGVQQIVQTNLCTACRTDHFFSHRAEKGRTGRFGAIIGLRGPSL